MGGKLKEQFPDIGIDREIIIEECGGGTRLECFDSDRRRAA